MEAWARARLTKGRMIRDEVPLWILPGAKTMLSVGMETALEKKTKGPLPTRLIGSRSRLEWDVALSSLSCRATAVADPILNVWMKTALEKEKTFVS